MNFETLKKIVEVLIFSSDRPLSLKQMKDIINEEKQETGLTADIRNIEKAVNELEEKYSSGEYSFSLVRVAGAYRFATRRNYAVWLAKLNKEKLKRKLSPPALETLAIIAYRQPITKSEIEAVRGVNVDYIIGALLEKDLITIRGRAEVVGRPMLYGTTDTLLEYFGINSIEDLPPLKAIEDIIKAGPPEGVTQSDIDFFEEINLIKSRQEAGELSEGDSIMPKDYSNIHEMTSDDEESARLSSGQVSDKPENASPQNEDS